MSGKSGFVAIVGRPNMGKSTLLNKLVGEKVSIISPKPQTTRCQIYGIKTVGETQIIYIDTPGMHREEKKAINQYMNRMAAAVLTDADVIVFIVTANEWHSEDEAVLKKLAEAKQPIILVINKIDLMDNKQNLLPYIEKLSQKFEFTHIIPLSALENDNLVTLESEITALLPEGPLLFPSHQTTDKDLQFQIAEIIREKIIYATEQELPYATTVAIEQFTQHEKNIEIGAVIWVERQGQKVIMIGKGGARLKKVGIKARRDLEKLLGKKIFLRLWVKVKENWTDDGKALQSFGYD